MRNRHQRSSSEPQRQARNLAFFIPLFCNLDNEQRMQYPTPVDMEDINSMIDTTTEEYQHFKERNKVIVVYKDAKSKHMLNSAPDMICSLVDLEYFNSLSYIDNLRPPVKVMTSQTAVLDMDFQQKGFTLFTMENGVLKEEQPSS